MTIRLPTLDRRLVSYELVHAEPRALRVGPAPQSRIFFAAAHVVADPLADTQPGESPCLDWEATLAFRRHLWRLGLRVAEAMDTAQRGSGLYWMPAQELIRRSVAEARTVGGVIACGAGTDHLASAGADLAQVLAAYEEQCGFVEKQGGRIILMASRALAACARNADDYRRMYGAILRQLSQPAILHWLGEPFDSALAGYWGSRDPVEAMEVCLGIIKEHAAKVDGIKLSLLDAGREIEMRRRLPRGVRMYTGDDFHYDELIAGDEQGHSDALLGIFDPIAEKAATAGRMLDCEAKAAFLRELAPTVPLARHLFRQPTYCYKTGVVFLAYLNGHQAHFRMVGGQESARSIVHLAELFRLADRAALFTDPECAVSRMRRVLAPAGIE